MGQPTTTKGRNVKSVQATDAHERAKDFLSATEVDKLLNAMKQLAPGCRRSTRICCATLADSRWPTAATTCA